jgi:hypothetical protein
MNLSLCLKTLCEVEGVLGAFISDVEGNLISRQTPDTFPDVILQGIGRRVPALFACSDKSIRGTEAVFLKFSLCQVMCVRISFGSLVVLCLDTVHVSALRTAATMIAQQIDTESASSVPRSFMPVPGR